MALARNASFPGALPTLPNIDPGDARNAEGKEEENILTRLGNEIESICYYLGTNPQGAYDNVKQRLERQGYTVANVKGFGTGIGEVGTDSTTAIANAISAVSGVGGVVFFPAGVYEHTGITVPDNVYLVGSGIPAVGSPVSSTLGTYLEYQQSTGSSIVFLGVSTSTHRKNSGIRQLGIGMRVANYASNTATGVSCTNSSHLVFADVHIRGFQTGLYGYELTNSLITGDWVIEDADKAIHLQSMVSVADTHHVRFEGGLILDARNNDIVIECAGVTLTQQPSYISFDGLVVESNKVQGGARIQLTSTAAVKFDNCAFAWETFDTGVSTATQGFLVEEGSRGFTLSNSTFTAGGDRTISSWIELNTTVASTLTNNKWLESNLGPTVSHINTAGVNTLLTDSGNGWTLNAIPGSTATDLTRIGTPVSVAYVRRSPCEVRGVGDGTTDQGDELRAVAAAAALLATADDPVTIHLEGVIAAKLAADTPASNYASIFALGSNVRLLGNGRLISLPRSSSTPAMGYVAGTMRTTNQLITNLNVDSSAPYDSNIQVLAGPAGFVIDGNSSAHLNTQSKSGATRSGTLSGAGATTRTLTGTSLTGLSGYLVKFAVGGALARITAVASATSCTIEAVPGYTLPTNASGLSYDIHNPPLLHGVRFYYAKDLLVGQGVVVQDCVGLSTSVNGYGVAFSNCNAVTDLSTVRWSDGPGFSGKGVTNSAVVRFGGQVFDVPYIGVADFLSSDVIVETATQGVKSIHALTQNSRHVRYTSAAKIGVGSTSTFLPITSGASASSATHGVKVVHEKRTGPVTIDADIQNISGGIGVEVIGPEPLTASSATGSAGDVTVTVAANSILSDLSTAEDANGWYTFSGWIDPDDVGEPTTGPHRIKAGNGSTTLVMDLAATSDITASDEIILGLDPIRIGGNVTGCTTGVAVGTSDANAQTVHASQVLISPDANVAGNTTDLGTGIGVIDTRFATIEEVQDNLGTSFLQAGDGVTLTYNDGADTLTVAMNAAETALLVLSDHTMAILRDEFFSGVSGTGNNWALRSFGTGSGRGSEPSVANHPGILEHLTGTTNTGYCQSDLGADPTASSGDAGFDDLHSYDWVVDMIVRVPAVATLTEDFVVRCGLGDSITSTAPSNGFYFEYDFDGTNHDWIGKTVNGGTVTSTSRDATATAATQVSAASWYRLTIAYDTGTDTATFYVGKDGGTVYQVGTSATNITQNPCGLFFGIYKSAGTTSRSLFADYICFAMTGLSR